MKVLHVFKDYYPPTHGGIEHLVHTLAHGLETRMDCAVLTSSRSRRLVVEDEEGVRITRAPEWFRISTAPIVPSWTRHLGETEADVVHFHMPNPTAELAYLAARTRTPAVATYHADIVRRGGVSALYAPLRRRFLGRMRRVVFSSPRLLDTTLDVASMRDRCAVIPFGVDVEAWLDRPPRADDIRRDVPGPIVLFLGRLVHYKGVEVLVEAMRSVDATLLVVGEGPKRPDIEAAVERFGVRDGVRLCGYVPHAELAAYCHAADVFVLPSVSRGEAYGLVLLEAMACGKPVVSTELGTGSSWVNVDRETGLVVPPRDPRALAAAINVLLADDERRRTMGEAARRRVLEYFTLERMLDAHADLYRSVA